jgi:hypothetical protein
MTRLRNATLESMHWYYLLLAQVTDIREAEPGGVMIAMVQQSVEWCSGCRGAYALLTSAAAAAAEAAAAADQQCQLLLPL